MKKKGFTLVELLAVIVIIAIIAVIATPIILNVIESAKEKAALEGFRGYLDAAEKAIILNELEEDEKFPKADENGCYILEKNTGLNTYIKIKGTAPTFEEGAKICFTKGNVTSATELIVDGYKISATTEDGKLVYKINGKAIEDEKEEEPTEPEETFTGITSGEHAVGSTLTYLGKNWKVMKDNGESTQLVMDGALSADELTANLPSDVASSYVSSTGMKMCYYAHMTGLTEFLKTVGDYCYLYDDAGVYTGEYSWNKSLVKPTIEKWLDSQMSAQGLTKEKELVGMAFTDGVETINSYIRIPLYDEVSSMNGTCSDYSPYCPDSNHYMYFDSDYWILTKNSEKGMHTMAFLRNTGVFKKFGGTNAAIRPVITVREK